VGRLAITDCKTFKTATKKLVRAAVSRGITDIFTRVIAQVLVRSNPPKLAYTLDICDPAQVAQVGRTMVNEARFIRATGLRGIWMDVEPYNNANLWYAEKQPGTQCYGKSYDAASAAYYSLGTTVGHALLGADPSIQILFSPGIEVSYYRTGTYAHFPDFYAGLLAVVSKTHHARGIVTATEMAYGWTNTSWFPLIVKYAMGTGTWSNHTSGLQEILQGYDKEFGTKTWQWHLKHDSIALGTWPLSRTGAWNYPADSFPQIVTAQRSASLAYSWIYDENGQWLKSSYTCTSQGQTVTGDLPCPGRILSATLPPLPKPKTP
jgi:hypothetical protein